MNIVGGFSYKIWILCLAGMTLLSLSGFSFNQELDEKVQSFLDSHQFQWRDMNVPRTDGRILYDIIVENSYTKALEIGTSTGHSSVWTVKLTFFMIAWTLQFHE